MRLKRLARLRVSEAPPFSSARTLRSPAATRSATVPIFSSGREITRARKMPSAPAKIIIETAAAISVKTACRTTAVIWSIGFIVRTIHGESTLVTSLGRTWRA